MNEIRLKVTPAAVFVFLMQLLYVASSSEISKSAGYFYIWTIGYMVTGLVALLACLNSSVDLWHIIKLCFIGALMTWSTLNSSGRELALMVLYWIVLKDANQNRLIKSLFYSNIMALMVNTALALIGISHVLDDKGNLTLGFVNSNFLGITVFNIVLLMIIQSKERLAKKYLVIAIIAGIVCWKYVNCRSAALAIAIMILLLFLRKILEEKKLFILVIKYSFILFAGISIIVGKIGVSNAALIVIDKILSGRIIAWNVYFQEKPITLFGTMFLASKFYALDNAYLYLLFRYGVIVFIIYCIASIYAVKRATDQRFYNMQIVILALAFYSLMEFGPMSVFNNIGLALLTTKATNNISLEKNE